MPPWKVQKTQKQARRWSNERVAEAMRVVATLNGDVKGVAANADYALETAVRRVAELASETRVSVRACSAREPERTSCWPPGSCG